MRFFAATLIFFGVAASSAQTPEVPHKIHFAGMSLTIRDDAKREIQKDVDALTRHSRYFEMNVERARTYFPIIEKIFQEENLPDDFKYLCLQESALVPDAVSVSNAVGFWQFKDFTAQEMGLRVDNEVDERMNIVSASRGAARYLKQSNMYFNNWLLALQSYQMGTGGVRRSIGDKYNGDSHMEITSETYWYIKKYLAHKIAFENACHGSPKLKITLLETSDRQLKDIAGEVSVDEDVLKEYNKWSRRGTIPGDKQYTVLVPAGNTIQDFNSLVINSEKAGKAIPQIKQNSSKEIRIKINGVEAIMAANGETLALLSARAGIDISRFIQYNDLAIDDKIIAGHFYFLKKKKKKNTQPIYRARIGDDLWSVSQQFGIQLKQLKKLNPETTNALLSAGTIIKLNSNATMENPLAEDASIEVAQLGRDAFAWGIQPPATSKSNSASDLKSSVQSSKDSIIKMTGNVFIEDPLPVEVKTNAVSIKHSDEPAKVGENSLPANSESQNPIEVSASGKTVDAIKKDTILTTKDPSSEVIIYVVKSSDTLYGIARQFGATIKELMNWNNKSVLTVTVGEKLRVFKR